jgi:transposase
LRAVFVEHRPLPEIADRFAVHCGTVRNWVSEFRSHWDRGQPPPFSPNRPADAL